MASLRELSEQFRLLYEMADIAAEGEEDIFQNTLEELAFDTSEKIDSACDVRSMLMSDSDMLDREIKRLTARKKRIDGNIKHIEYRIEEAVKLMPDRKCETSLYKVSFRKNPAKVVIDEGADIPIRFIIAQPPKTDLDGLKKAMKNGETFDGIRLENGESLSIR